jgi:hypothetical protein
MLEILALAYMTLAALRSTGFLRRNTALLREFGASTAWIPLVYLFPLGPAILLFLPMMIGLVPAAALALACYAPVLCLLPPARKRIEQSGTDRTRDLGEALGTVFITGAGGAVYVTARTGIVLLMGASATLG